MSKTTQHLSTFDGYFVYSLILEVKRDFEKQINQGAKSNGMGQADKR
jgi:hypothetical protein